MPIINTKLSAPPIEKPNTVQIAAPKYKGVTVNTRYTASTALITHIEGSSWRVNYYSQILNEDSALAGQNVTRNALYQQYKLIKDFEFKVTSPLSISQDDTNKTMLYTGTANTYSNLMPNEGDMFLADIGDGREALFKITMTERKAIFKDTTYVVEYQMIDYSTEERRADLNSKVIETVYFVRDFLQYGQNPLIHEEDYIVIKKLQSNYQDIASRYFNAFTSNEFKTLIVPGQEYPVYDHFLTKAVTSCFTTFDTPEIRTIRKLNCDGDDAMLALNIWDVLIRRDKSLLKYCNRFAGLVQARSFEKNPMMEGIYHSGISYVVYPKDPEENVDTYLKKPPKLLSDTKLTNVPSRVRRLADLISDNKFEGLTRPDVRLMNPVTVDDYYVLSDAFYNDKQLGQSGLELCVRDYLDNKPLDNKMLLAFTEVYHAWGALERFYYIPIILILIKSSIRNF